MKKINKKPPYILKRVVIFLWLLTTTALLWYFSLSIEKEVSFHQFLNFLIILWGSGFAFHVLTKLLNYDYGEENMKEWSVIAIHLFAILICYCLIAIGLVVGKSIDGSLGYILAYTSSFLGMLFAFIFFLRLTSTIDEFIK